MIYCVGGVSGTGKSTLIYSHPQLKGLKHIDIAQAYRDAEQRNARISWQQALDWLINEATTQLQKYPDDSFVLEAFFRPGKLQRREIRALAHQHNQKVQFLWCHASRYQCYNRVRRDQRDSPSRRAARFRFIRDARFYMFHRRRSEDPDRKLDSRGFCQQCHDFRELKGPYYHVCDSCAW